MKNPYVEKAIVFAGSQSALARYVGRSQSLINDWLNNKKRVSVDSVPLIVELTAGGVKAYQLRPDLPGVFPRPATEV